MLTLKYHFYVTTAVCSNLACVPIQSNMLNDKGKLECFDVSSIYYQYNTQRGSIARIHNLTADIYSTLPNCAAMTAMTVHIRFSASGKTRDFSL